MEYLVFLKGLIIGFSIAAPVGPIGLLVIRRTLAEGRVVGLLSGLGAASADAVYGLIAGLGLSVIIHFLLGQQVWLQLLGGLFLCYLGAKTAFSTASENPAKVQSKHFFGAYLSVFFLTLTNPVTILSFIAIFAGLGLTQSQATSTFTLVLGVFLGSGLWWLILSFLVGFFKEFLKTQALSWINRISGIIIFLYGAYPLISLIGR